MSRYISLAQRYVARHIAVYIAHRRSQCAAHRSRSGNRHPVFTFRDTVPYLINSVAQAVAVAFVWTSVDQSVINVIIYIALKTFAI